MLDLESWFEQFREQSDTIRAYWEAEVDNDICGWAKTLRAAWKNGTQPLLGGVMLFGGDGTGRHNTAVQLAADRAQFGHVVYYATGDDLWADAENYNDVHERLERLLCGDGDDGAVLVLEQWEDHAYTSRLLNELGLLLCRFRQGLEKDAEYLPIFVVLIADDHPRLPALLRQMIRTVRMTLPDQVQREEYLSMQDLAGEIEDEIELKDVAKLAEGCSYKELSDLVLNLHDRLAADRFAKKPDASAFVMTQAGTDARQRNEDQLMQELRAYLKAVPEQLSRLESLPMSAPVAAQPESAGIENAGSDSPIRYTSEQLSEMRVRDMITIGFDEDVAKVLLSAKVGGTALRTDEQAEETV